MQNKHIKSISALAGCIFGIIIAHPYVMLVYFLTNPTAPMGQGFNLDLAKTFRDTFSYEMLPMALSFSFFCSLIGFLLGLLYEKKQKFSALKAEMEKKEAGVEAMEKLLSILSHFILNSTMVITSGIRQLRRSDCSASIGDILDKIEKQAEKNEEIITHMKSHNYLYHIHDADKSISRILELTRSLEKCISK